MGAGAAAAEAGARGPGGPEAGSGLWGDRRLPQGLAAQPRPRRLRGVASGLQRGDRSLPALGRLQAGRPRGCACRGRSTASLGAGKRPPPPTAHGHPGGSWPCHSNAGHLPEERQATVTFAARQHGCARVPKPAAHVLSRRPCTSPPATLGVSSLLPSAPGTGGPGGTRSPSRPGPQPSF